MQKSYIETEEEEQKKNTKTENGNEKKREIKREKKIRKKKKKNEEERVIRQCGPYSFYFSVEVMVDKLVRGSTPSTAVHAFLFSPLLFLVPFSDQKQLSPCTILILPCARLVSNGPALPKPGHS